MFQPVFVCVVPGGRGQWDEQGLQDSSDVDDGALLGDEEVHAGQDEETVQNEAHHHSDGVKAQLLPHRGRVAHLQDLTGHQKHDAEREVPAQ